MENNTTNFAAQNSAPAPVQSVVSAPVSNKQGGTKKTPTILMIVFLVTTLGFAGAFAWVMLNGSNSGISTDKSDAKCIVTQEQVDNPEEGTVAEVVADFEADSYIRGLMRKINNKILEYAYSFSKKYDDGVNYYADNYIVKTSKSYGVSINSNGWRDTGGASSSVDSARRAVAQILADEGFVKDSSKSSSENEGGYYKKDSYICNFISNEESLSIDCASENWFTSADKALADSLNAVKGYNKDFIISANMNYVTTTSDGLYERAEIPVSPANSPVGSHIDLFYRKVDGGEWAYVTGIQGMPNCAEFEGDAIKAYSDFACFYQENGQLVEKLVGE